MWKITDFEKRPDETIDELTLQYMDTGGSLLPKRPVIPCHITEDPPKTKTVDDLWVAAALSELARHIYAYHERERELSEQDLHDMDLPV